MITVLLRESETVKLKEIVVDDIKKEIIAFANCEGGKFNLVKGISINDIMMGISVCRNSKLANVFYRLQLIEAYGTGNFGKPQRGDYCGKCAI